MRRWYLDLRKCNARHAVELLNGSCLAVVSRVELGISKHQDPVDRVARDAPVLHAQLAISSINPIAGGRLMNDSASAQQMLQGLIDATIGLNLRDELSAWEKAGWPEDPGTHYDEAPLKYIAMVIMDAVANKAVRISIDKDSGAAVHGDTTYQLPKAPSSFIARGLEILREIAGMEGPSSRGSIIVEIPGESLELILQKDRGRHTVTIPNLRSRD